MKYRLSVQKQNSTRNYGPKYGHAKQQTYCVMQLFRFVFVRHFGSVLSRLMVHDYHYHQSILLRPVYLSGQSAAAATEITNFDDDRPAKIWRLICRCWTESYDIV